MAEPPSLPERSSILHGQARNVFVGRQREMAELRGALDDALSGQGRLVMLAGEPGIGKTRTAQELASYAEGQGAKVLWGWCYEEGGAPPYWPWVQTIRSYVQQCDAAQLQSEMNRGAANIADVVPEIHTNITDLKPSPALEPEAARFRLFNSITSFLKNAAQTQPLMLVLDDLHWADKPSLLLLQFLARELAPAESGRLLVVGCYRDLELSRQHPLSETLAQLSRTTGGGGGGGLQRVLLRGLNQEDTSRFIEASAGIEPTTGLAEALYSHTEGNPFFMTEVIRLLSESGELTAEHIGTPGGLRIPEGVREVVGQRLNRLSEQCNEVLTTACVIGREFDFRVLSALSDGINEDHLLATIDEAVQARLIEEVTGRIERYQFCHALIQQTLTDELTTSRRVRLHARIGEALEDLYGAGAEAHSAELAHHFAEAVPVLGPEKLVRYSLQAGDRALEAYAHEEALTHFDAGLASMAGQPVDAEKAALLFGIGRAQSILQLDASASSLRMAFDYYLDVVDLEQVVAIAEYGDYGTGVRGAGKREMLNLALGVVPSGSHYAGRLLCRYGQAVGLLEDDYEEARDALEQALVIARREGDPALEMNALSASASVDGFHTLYESGLINSLNAIRLSDQVSDPRPLLNAHYFATSALMIQGDLEQARQHATAMLEPSERLRDRFWIEGACWKNASVARLAGDWKEVRSICTGGMDISIRRHPLLMELTLAEYESGDSLQGDSHLQQLLELTQQGADFGYGNLIAPIVARISGSFDYLGVVESLAKSRIESSTAPPASKVIAEIGLALIAILKNEPIAAERHYSTFADRRGNMVNWTFSADRLLGLLCETMGQPDKAAGHFDDALAFCRKAGYCPELAWACCDYADTLLQRASTGSAQASRGDRAKAVSLLEESLSISTELGMRPLMERVEERLERTQSLRPREPAFPGGLTRREVEVLRLIATGKTDREIGEELVIGVRTVTTHVGNILNKIGAANRAEASSFATRNGLA